MKKKLIALITLIMLLLFAAHASYAITAEDVTGEWVLTKMKSEGISFSPADANYNMTITFQEGGQADLFISQEGEEDIQAQGTWQLTDDAIKVVMELETAYIQIDGSELVWDLDGTLAYFQKDVRETTAAVPIDAKAKEDFDGYWRLSSVEIGGMKVNMDETLSAYPDHTADLFIESGKAELNVNLGDEPRQLILDTMFMGGKLYLSQNGNMITFVQLLSDGQISFEWESGGQTGLLIMARAERSEAQDNSNVQAEVAPDITATPEPEPTQAPSPTPQPAETAAPVMIATPSPVPYEQPADADRRILPSQDASLVHVGKTLKLTVTVEKLSEDAPAKSTLEWASSDVNIAKINAQGGVTGVAPGSTFVICSLKDRPDIKAYIPVTVIRPVKSIKPDEPNKALLLGASAEAAQGQITVTINPENATIQQCSFLSSDESIVKINENGALTAVAPGKARITITPLENGTKVSAVCNVTVSQAVEKINIPQLLTVDKKKTLAIKPEILPADATNKKLQYESRNEKIAKVSKDGVITGVACGETVIVCSATDGSGITAACRVTVVQAVTGLKLSEQSITLGKGKSHTVKATILPEDATNKNLKWTSSKTSIAAVSPKGAITANQGGDCEITCTTEDGSKSATIKVHVPTFSVDATEYTILSKNGRTIPIHWDTDGITLTLTDNGGTVFNANWDSDYNIQIVPLRAGTGSIVINNENAPKDKVTIKIIVDHSAAYDSTSYPAIRYTDALRYPDAYSGDKCSFTGKVLQVMGGTTTTSYLISSRGNYRDYVYVTINNSDILTPVLEDDKVTVYGKYNGTKTYSNLFSGDNTVPQVQAERINVK